MAIANFFEKAAKAAAHVIQNLDANAFAQQLQSHSV